MATLWLEFGTGFQVNGNGGLSMATEWDETRQWLERFSFTVPKMSCRTGLRRILSTSR